MTPFPNRLTYRAQPRFISKVIGCGFQILYITGYLIDRFVLLNGTQSNIIAVLGYLTGWYKQCSHFYTVSRTDLNKWAFYLELIHIFQMLSQKCHFYNYFGIIESVRFFIDRPNKSYNFYYNFPIKTDRQLPGFFLGLAPPLLWTLWNYGNLVRNISIGRCPGIFGVSGNVRENDFRKSVSSRRATL